MPVIPRVTDEWTVADLDEFVEGRGDDGLSYELLDGLLLVCPAPVPRHQRVVGELYRVLVDACPPGVEVLFAPLDWRPDERTSLQPDLLAFRHEDARERHITGALLLAVEVLSPSTRRKDLVLKYAKYADAGVLNYWVVDPVTPSLVAYRLQDGAYVEVAAGEGETEVRVPGDLAVVVRPSALVASPAQTR
ncbi:Uma2 family endonuclease [Spongisporangium articulatum]|uniref:Uma2 family endonuclease n=1 Tax=Spongisporangium articulatum TaxID=3362603 RepID=A0ABW8AK61_9ACTN